MNLIKKQGPYLAMTLCSGISALLLFMAETGVHLHTGWLAALLCVWILFVALLDRETSPIVPFLMLLYLGFLYVRFNGGFGIFETVLIRWAEDPETLWIPGDGLAGLGLMTLSLILLYGTRYRWSRAALALLLCGLWIAAAVTGRKIPKAAVILQLPVLLFSLIDLLHIKSREQRKNEASILAVTGVFCLLLAVLPVSAEPYPYTLVHKAWNGIEELWKRVETQLAYRSSGGSEFEIAFNGGQAQSIPQEGGKEAEQRLRVWLDYGEPCILYLPGASLDHFDGAVWSRTLDDQAAGELLHWQYDTAEHIYALWRRDRDAEERSYDVFRRRRLEIDYQKMDTWTLFTVEGLLRIKTDEERFPFHTENGRVAFDYTQKRDTVYTLYFLEDNTDPVEALIQDAEGYVYDKNARQSWGQIAGDYSEQFLLHLVNTVQIEQALAARQDLIDTYYLQLPDSLSEKVRDLALSLTEDCATDYEKIQAIASYLQTNFTYTLQPDRPAASEDFLEHMLEEKEGYCTWFATASTILLRASGVPARYVQGYRTVLDGQSRVRLYQDDAHAWCEGYVQGYGWVIVEGTPGYSTSDAAWEYKQKEEAEEAAEEEAAVEEEPAAAETERRAFPILWVLATIALIGGCAALTFLQRRKKAYERLPWSGRAWEDLRRILRLLEKKSFVRYPYESIRTFFHRVPWEDLAIDPKAAQEALQVFEDALFGERGLDEEAWQKEQKLLAELKKHRKKKRRK